MSKFVKVEWNNDFEAIREYISKNKGNNYYIAPELMGKFLCSFRVQCVVGTSESDVKMLEHDGIDFSTIPVYNKVFQTHVFKIQSIKINDTLVEIENKIEYDSVAFGLEEDMEEFEGCFDYEELN